MPNVYFWEIIQIFQNTIRKLNIIKLTLYIAFLHNLLILMLMSTDHNSIWMISYSAIFLTFL